MADFATNAKNLAELDLALIEAEALSYECHPAYVKPKYQTGGIIRVVDSVVNLPTTAILYRAAYLSHRMRFDGKATMPDEETEWTRVRREKPETLNDHSTHNLYPFEGKMMPQLARALINICSGSASGVRLGDPFCGSGTVLLEGALLGHSVFGCDVDPFAVWLTVAKLSPTADLLSNAVDRLGKFMSWPGDSHERPSTMRDAYFKCHHSANFSVQEMSAEVFLSPAQMFDVIVTSPPYYDAIDYTERHHPLRQALNLTLNPKYTSIGAGQTIDEYELSVKTVCFRLARALVKGGKCAIVVADHHSVPTSAWYELYLKSAGMQVEYRLRRPYLVPTRGFNEDVILIARKSGG